MSLSIFLSSPIYFNTHTHTGVRGVFHAARDVLFGAKLRGPIFVRHSGDSKVKSAIDWRYSSFHRIKSSGLLFGFFNIFRCEFSFVLSLPLLFAFNCCVLVFLLPFFLSVYIHSSIYLFPFPFSATPLIFSYQSLFFRSQEIYPPSLVQFADLTDGACTDKQILKQEIQILSVSVCVCVFECVCVFVC